LLRCEGGGGGEVAKGGGVVLGAGWDGNWWQECLMARKECSSGCERIIASGLYEKVLTETKAAAGRR